MNGGNSSQNGEGSQANASQGGGLSSRQNHRRRYKGLLKRSPLKNFRDDVFRFLDYVSTMAPADKGLMTALMTFTMSVGLIQACSPASSTLWDRETLSGVIMNVLSVFALLTPASLDQDTFQVVALAIVICVALSYVFTAICFVTFIKVSKIAMPCVLIISWMLNGFIPLELLYIGGFVGRCGAGLYMNNGSVVMNAVVMLLGICELVLLMYIQVTLVCPTLAFRPQVLACVFGRIGKWFYILFTLFAITGTMGSCIEGIVGGLFVYISAIILIGIFVLLWKIRYGIALPEDTMRITKYFSAAAILALVLGTLDIVGANGAEYCYVIIAVVFVGCQVFVGMIVGKSDKAMAEKVEQVAEDPELFEELPYTTALTIVRLSFEWGHAAAHKWSLIESMNRRYPGDPQVNIIFAKYAAIYPDETMTLRMAARRILDAKHGNFELKWVAFQIFSLLQQRETRMSHSIKKAIFKVTAKIEKARGQIRYLWECVIRGNLDEIEGLAVRLKDLQAEITRDYNQLCLVYPNNPYVARSYASYLRDLANDEEGAVEMQGVYQQLRMGKRTRVERCYLFASRLFPRLPTDEQHSSLVNANHEDKNAGMSITEGRGSVSASQVGHQNRDQMIQANVDETAVQKGYVESMVESVKVPAMRYGPLLIIVVVVILMPICIIPITITVIDAIHTVESAVRVVEYSGLLRFQFVELILWTYQLAYDRAPNTRFMSTMSQRWDATYGAQNYELPANWSTDEEGQVAALMKARDILNTINSVAPNLENNGVFSEALDVLYGNVNVFPIYSTHNDLINYDYSLDYICALMLDIGMKASTNANARTYLDEFQFWTMIKDTRPLMLITEDFATKVLKGITLFTSNSRQSVMLEVILAICLPFVVSFAFNIFLVVRLEKEKRQIYSVFKALPKSSLSAIIQNLNAQSQKDNQEEGEEVTGSAQEENALRVLTTSVDHGFGWIGRSWQIILILAIFSVASIVVCVVLVYFTYNICDTFDKVNPLFNEIPRATTQYLACTLCLLRMAAIGEFADGKSGLPENAKANYALVMEDLEYFMSDLTNIINHLRIANEGSNATGMSVGGSELIELLTMPDCVRQGIEISSQIDVLMCTSFEAASSFLIQRMWQVYYIIYLSENKDIVIADNSTLSFSLPTIHLLMCWMLGFGRSQFVDPAITSIDNLIVEEVALVANTYIIIPVAVCVALIMICGLAIVPNYIRVAEGGRWSLRLLLFCQPEVVMQTKPIVKILSNDFSPNEDTQKDQNNGSFYETVVSSLLDGVVFVSNKLEIMSANAAVESTVGLTAQEVIGRDLLDIFVAPEGNDSSLKAFVAAVRGAMNSQRSPGIEAEVEVLRKGEPVTLGITVTTVSTAGAVLTKATNAESIGVMAVVMKDMTATIAANRLLTEEGVKSEKLLLMILPPIIVTKLQSGEKDISFSVKTASILFLDIVSFTPWCGSHTAEYVMSTLNRMFLEYDRIMKTYDRMTKIKCIGDCYMCAGGIFDEINQPAEHTKQIVSFGIDIIKALQLLNIELKETLRIRVGVNTGGPIVAGVLGIEKPTFDILGPDICLAAKMESSGVPMTVHIPHHCYELVYASGFRIRERGIVEVKGKKYTTYCVHGYDRQE